MVCVVTVNYIRSGSFISHLFIEKPTSETICTSKCSKKRGGGWGVLGRIDSERCRVNQ